MTRSPEWKPIVKLQAQHTIPDWVRENMRVDCEAWTESSMIRNLVHSIVSDRKNLPITIRERKTTDDCTGTQTTYTYEVILIDAAELKRLQAIEKVMLDPWSPYADGLKMLAKKAGDAE